MRDSLRLAESGEQPQADWVANVYLDVLTARIAWSRVHRGLFDADPDRRATARSA